jgi:competence ComEA-like helix-hairpin-helix protein
MGRQFAVLLSAVILVSAVVVVSSSYAPREARADDLFELVADPGNDGDSFMVRPKAAGGTQFEVRLCFVDCPERSDEGALKARVEEQVRYFGLDENSRGIVIEFGRTAKAKVEEQLKNPFTLHGTGHKAGAREYVFVTTSEGKDLGSFLVEEGLARVADGCVREGVKRTPGRVPSSHALEDLRDIEVSAMTRGKGIWQHTNKDKLLDQRKSLRFDSVNRDGLPYKININKASKQELELHLWGVGPEIAARIVEERVRQPFKTMEELKTRVKGIGEKKFERFLGQITVSDRININKATEEEIMMLDGVRADVCSAIFEERDKGGSYKDSNDLEKRVKGVGEKTIEKLSEQIFFREEDAGDVPSR